ncbi:MAG: hypothetical protein ABSG86_06245 [Thermoguttaceae bacterium]
MFRKYVLCAFGAITCATALAVAARAQDVQDPYLAGPSCGVVSDLDVRMGYWASHTTGSPVKVGEYQDLASSLFYDVDMLRSNGTRTLDFTANGTDPDANNVYLHYFGPGLAGQGLEANVNYQSFIHNLGHDNLGQFTDSGGTNNNTDNGATGANIRGQQFLRQDFNPGEDYAIRVQEFKANFKAELTPDLRIRLDVWGIDKEGTRQVNSMQECYPHTYATIDPTTTSLPAQSAGGTNHCHILSQSQHIDWQTTEVKPVVEWNLGPVVIEYSRPMRTFTQDDQTVYRFYDFEGVTPGSKPYSLVPDNTTQIDQFKLNVLVNEDNRFYGFFYTGNTRSEGEAVLPSGELADEVNNRRMTGADIRWTNTTIDNVTITPYARYVKETNLFSEEADTTFPINYERSQAGVRTLWRPFGGGFGLGGLAIKAEYEYGDLHRANLDFPQDGIGPAGGPGPSIAAGEIDEEHTRSNIFSIGPTVRWSPQFDTYLKYKYYDTQDALYAVAYHNPSSRDSPPYSYAGLSTNSALPEYDNIIELGGTWLPNDRFMLNGWIGFDMQSQSEGQLVINNTFAPSASRTEALTSKTDNYPCGLNGSYRAGDKWTLNFGAAYFTNWIDQDVTFSPGSDHGFGGTVTPPFPAGPNQYGALLNRLAYGGRAGVFNLGATYRLSPRLRFQAQGEYVHGIDSAYQLSGDPNFPQTNAATASIPGIFRDDVVITRVSAGIDYLVSKRCTAYFRYVLFDYQDSADKTQLAASTLPVDGLPLSGTSNLFLTGLNATF